MSGITASTQRGAVAALLADATVLGLVADTVDGPAVFAPGGPFSDAYPRLSLEAPQRIDKSTSCSVAADMIVTVHSWAKGPGATLVAGDLADAAIAALSFPLTIAGHRVSSWSFEGTRPAGDPQADVEHLVSTFRYSVQASA